MAEYKNKSVAELREKVGKAFNRIDKYGYRDDEEIYEAGRIVIGDIIKTIKKENKVWGKRALQKLNDLSMEYEKYIQKTE